MSKCIIAALCALGIVAFVSSASAEDEVKAKKGALDVNSGASNVKLNEGSLEVKTDVDGSAAGSNEVSADGKEVSINGNHRTVTHACTADAPKRVTISGTQHTITITGACDNVTVSGMKHTVTIESTASITVSGMENKVMYKSGMGKKKPSITTSGMKNSVVKIAEK